MALDRQITIVSSDYVKFEIEEIPDRLKRKDVRGFEGTFSSVNIASSEEIADLARRFSSECSLNPLDASHVSAACVGIADCFITCDEEILHGGSCVSRLAAEKGYRLKVRNPVRYLKEKRGVRNGEFTDRNS